MTRVVYIAGWGRSGTTLLDNILHAYPGAFSVGELFYLWRRGLVQGRRCGCGLPLPQCPLWRRIRRAAFGAAEPEPREMMALQAAVSRVRHAPGLRTRTDPAVRRYQDVLGRLYRAVADVTGARVIIDSSKTPAGAAMLPRLDGITPYLVHMVRDPRAVAHSWMRPTPQVDRSAPAMMARHDAWESTVQWLGTNTLIEGLAGDYGTRRLRLRYEDLMARPREEVDRILRGAGLPRRPSPFLDERQVVLGPNHTVSGNPGRFRRGAVPLRLDDAWTRQLPTRARVVATAVALPLLHRYGYPVGVPGAA